MQNEIIVDIHDIYDDRKVEINFFAQHEFKSFWRFVVFLTENAEFDESIEHNFVYFML